MLRPPRVRASRSPSPRPSPPGRGRTVHHVLQNRVNFVIQEIRVEEKFALATAKIRWQAQKGQVLPLLFGPAVLTHISYPASALNLEQSLTGGKRAHQLVARQSGSFDIEVQYQVDVIK